MAEETPKTFWTLMQEIDWKDVRQKVVSGLVLAIIVGAVGALGTYIWNDVSKGGLVRVLGGVTKEEMDAG